MSADCWVDGWCVRTKAFLHSNCVQFCSRHASFERNSQLIDMTLLYTCLQRYKYNLPLNLHVIHVDIISYGKCTTESHTYLPTSPTLTKLSYNELAACRVRTNQHAWLKIVASRSSLQKPCALVREWNACYTTVEPSSHTTPLPFRRWKQLCFTHPVARTLSLNITNQSVIKKI